MDKGRQDEVKRRFGARVRQLREAQDQSQEELAFTAGIDRSYLSAIERGKRNVALINIHRIAEALSVQPAELFQA